LRGFGPFVDSPPSEALLLLQSFMGIVGVMTLALAAAVTQIRVAEDDLRVAHADLELRVAQRTQELAEAQALAHLGAWSWDLETGAMTWSDELYRILGRSPQEGPLAADSLWSHVHSGDRHRLQELFARARVEGESSTFDVRAVRADGQTVWLQGLVQVVKQRGVPVRLHGIARDVTETRLAATERDRLEKEILEVGSRERQRLGQDLHDGLGQHLTGIAFLAKSLERKLQGLAMRGEAGDIVHIRELVNDAITKTRSLARGLSPASLETGGLAAALQDLAASAETLFNVSCTVHATDPALSCGTLADTHLYYIAQESITNAIKHGRARDIRIRLGTEAGRVVLRIEDDGSGYDPASTASGMGLRIMRHRARMIGADCDIERRPDGGTVVCCLVPRGADLDTDERTG
jgi:PAS domain S-box-containing protein